ncbi:hypothetical protein BGW37DRAFT_497443 [Umbelopsis sp. PMI_123]|nr:hypothetical protein BGW37DRAFT_497443 [Umbelopsis sp. PMI_123]
MLKPRYSRSREAREQVDSEEEGQQSDHSSISGDLSESSDASTGSEDDEGNSSGGEAESSVPLRSRYEQREKKSSGMNSGDRDGWGSPPKIIDKDSNWSELNKTSAISNSGENTSSPADSAISRKKKDDYNQKDASTTSIPRIADDSSWGNVLKETDSLADGTSGSLSQSSGVKDHNENWERQSKGRGKFNGPARGRGSALKSGRGNRGGQRGARIDFSDRSVSQATRGGKKGAFQRKPNDDNGPRSNKDNSSTERLRDDQLPWSNITASGTDMPPKDWKSFTESNFIADSDTTLGNTKKDKDREQNTSAPLEAQGDNGWDQASDKPKDEGGWGEAPTNNLYDNWKTSDNQDHDNNLTEKTAQLKISDKKPNNDGEEGFKRNAVHQRRLEARREYRKKLEEDPSFVPHLGEFWSHDDRFRDDEMKNNTTDRRRDSPRGRGRGRGTRGGADLFDGQSASPATGTSQKWTHDGYESLLRMEEREEQDRRNKTEQMEQHGEYDQSRFAGDRGFGRQRGRGRGFRGGRGRSDRFGRTTRETSVDTGSENDSTKATSRQSKDESISSKPATVADEATSMDQESSTANQANVTTSGNSEEDSDVEIILETPQWQTEQVLGIPTPKSTGSEKSLTGEEQTEAGTAHGGDAQGKFRQTDSPSANWGKPNSRLSPKASDWEQHDDQQEYSQEHPYPTHTMLSPNAMQFVPMTTMASTSSNMIPMQAMYAVPMSMSGSREGIPGPIMYAPVMNSQQGMYEANGMFYYNYDASQVPMYTPVMYYPQSPMPAENDRAYHSPKWGYSRKYTQQDRSRGKHGSSGPQ